MKIENFVLETNQIKERNFYRKHWYKHGTIIGARITCK